ncbi:MAG: hypothetical protein PHI97_33015 [Desulfobulbus sp.]|nr:hypothetical protein [Desulfobulbus sp.]
MIAAILFYLTWLCGAFLLSCLISAFFKVWWSLYALSNLEEYQYTVVTCTPFDDLQNIKPICDQNGISYTLIYFGRLCGRAMKRIRG